MIRGIKKYSSERLLSWFQNNEREVNMGKIRLPLSNTKENTKVSICNEKISCTNRENVLGVIVGNR